MGEKNPNVRYLINKKVGDIIERRKEKEEAATNKAHLNFAEQVIPAIGVQAEFNIAMQVLENTDAFSLEEKDVLRDKLLMNFRLYESCDWKQLTGTEEEIIIAKSERDNKKEDAYGNVVVIINKIKNSARREWNKIADSSFDPNSEPKQDEANES